MCVVVRRAFSWRSQSALLTCCVQCAVTLTALQDLAKQLQAAGQEANVKVPQKSAQAAPPDDKRTRRRKRYVHKSQ